MNRKSLSESITAFRNNINDRKQRINTKLASLDREIEGLNADIEAEASRLVTTELDGDTVAQGKSNKTLAKLRQRLTEVQDLATAYRKELTQNSYGAADLENIRLAAARELADRWQKVRDLTASRDSIQQQIEQLQRQLSKVENEIRAVKASRPELQLLTISSAIEPRLKLVPSFDQGNYLIHWISGSTEAAQQVLDRHIAADGAPPQSPQPNITRLNRTEYVSRGEPGKQAACSGGPVGAMQLNKAAPFAGRG